MYFTTKSFITLILLAVVILPGYSQYRKKKFDISQGLSISPLAGANFFYGDLVDQSRTSYSAGVAAERELNTFLNARTSIMIGNMKGQQLNGQEQVYASFSNFYTEYTLGLTYRPLDHTFGYFRQRGFNPYIIAQFGINYFTATEKYGEGAGTFQSWERNPPGEPRDGEVWHKKSGITPLVSMGGGLSYFLNPRFRIRAEVIANKPFSDELDGHKEWEDNEGVIYKTDAGDFYYTAALGATIIINDSRWKNEPKYARKAYTKLRKFRSTKSNGKRKKLPSRPKRRR